MNWMSTAPDRDRISRSRAAIDASDCSTSSATIAQSVSSGPGAAAREGGALGASGPLPTAEELGAELERFLADHSKRRGDDPRA